MLRPSLLLCVFYIIKCVLKVHTLNVHMEYIKMYERVNDWWINAVYLRGRPASHYLYTSVN